MATFPSYACILLNGYGEERSYGVLRTEMDAAIDKQRPRWSKAKVTRDVQIKVNNKTDKSSFDTWLRDDLNGGTGWFDWTDPLDSTTKQARLVGGTVRWTTPGVIWIGEAELETIE